MLLEIQKRDSALQESEQQFRTLADSISQLAWTGDAKSFRIAGLSCFPAGLLPSTCSKRPASKGTASTFWRNPLSRSI
jgi:hypothetical protein